MNVRSKTMKTKKLIVLAALLSVAALSSFSCRQAIVEPVEDPDAEVKKEAVALVISATQRDGDTSQEGSDTRADDPNPLDPDTRTVLVDGAKVWWLPEDKLAVFSSVDKASFTSLNSQAAASTLFSGTIDVNPDDPGYIHALYPYDADATCVGGTFTTTLPNEQMGADGTFSDDLLILAGRSLSPFTLTGEIDFIYAATGMETDTFFIDDDGTITGTDTPGQAGGSSSPDIPAGARTLQIRFDHVCSGLRFTLTQPGIETVTLTATGGEAIAGQFSFAYNGNGEPVVTSVANPSSSITLTAPDGGTFTPGVWYYFVTLPVSFSQGVTFTLTSGSKVGTRTIATPFALNRGAFRKATNLDSNVELEEQEVEVQIADPTTWTAVDELGRSVLSGDNPSTKEHRDVLMFYWTWHEGHQVTNTVHADGKPGITDNSVVLMLAPEAADDYFHPYWKNSQVCFWGRPLFDYYRSTDPWVLRKHAEMLADAGVDAVVFDCTNGTYLWWDSTMALLQTWSQAKQDGVKVPKIAFLLNFIVCDATKTSLRYLYNNLYSRGLYQDLWYYVDGKPLIMAFPESLDSSNSTDQAIKRFFTFRRGQADYVNGDVGTSTMPYWGWLETTTQHLFNGEQMTVGVSQNATDQFESHCYAFNAPGSYGRSHTRAHGNDLLSGDFTHISTASFIHGYNFQEQWDTALQADPKYIFITGWNEWIAGKSPAFPIHANGDIPYYKYDKATGTYYYYVPYGIWNKPSGPPAFADQYDSERSRDIEPTHFWGDYGDVYYYQLAKNIRQYKGVAAYPNVSRKQTMDIDGVFSGWEKVSPDFKHYRGNTFNRYHYNHCTDGTIYVDNTGRNDIVDARVTRDKDYIYFYVETDQAITSYTGSAWMRLFINIDRNAATGWKGYDFCLNYRTPSSATKGYVSRNVNNAWSWTDAGTFDYAVNGNKMELRVSRSLLNVTSGKLDFEFKWSDNMQLYNSDYNVDNNNGTAWILDFLVSGDCAPGGRFNFHYKEP